MTSVFSTPPTNGTDIVIEKKMKIETVIVILWASGGVLLLMLMVLLVCILKTNKKGRAQRSSVFGISDGCGGTRHGGVNPGFTNYDEIWTWIPVVRGNDCQGTGPQEVRTSHVAEDASATLSRTLEPPPYSIAISTPSFPPSTRYTTAASTSSVSSSSGYASAPSTSVVAPTPRYSVSSSSNNQDNSSLPVSTEINLSSALLTTSSITGPITSVSDSFSRNTYAERLRESSHNILRRNERQSRASAHVQVGGDGLSHRAGGERLYRIKSSSCTVNPSASSGEGENSNSDVIARGYGSRVRENEIDNIRCEVRSPRPERNMNVASASSVPAAEDYDETQDTALKGYEYPSAANASPTCREFSYDAEAGLYAFSTGTNGRMVWCDIPPSLMDEEGPPPYTPPPSYAHGRSSRSNRHCSREERTAPIVRLPQQQTAVLDIPRICSQEVLHENNMARRGLNTTIFNDNGLLVSRV